MKINDKYSEDKILKNVEILLSEVGMSAEALYLMPDELSGGMHRRVAIARSLAVFHPKMFLYDEPTTGLDPVNAYKICKLILDLCKNECGFMIVTHKVQDALKVAERFMFIKDGIIDFDGDKYLLINSEKPEVVEFTEEVRILETCLK